MFPALQWQGRREMAMGTQAGEDSSCPLVPVLSVGSRQAQLREPEAGGEWRILHSQQIACL